MACRSEQIDFFHHQKIGPISSESYVDSSWLDCSEENAAYIAAANPTAILKLLSINAELLEALSGVMYWDNGKPEWQIARAAIARYEGEQHDGS